jgi:NADH-quinone oxidoreductase subunit N
LGTIATSLISYGYLENCRQIKEEYYVLLVLAALGASVLVCSSHFATFFIGLEILNVALYALIAYTRDRLQSIEAGYKYLILAAASDAFLLFGMALVYAVSGSLEFPAQFLKLDVASNPLGMTGLAMITLGIGFKLAVVPFHMWTPDVYQGAPAPVTGFISTISKGAVFALMFRYFGYIETTHSFPIIFLFSLISAASMFVGNLLALYQNNVKRILAYSSIAHMGYLIIAFVAGGKHAFTAVAFYLTAYFITNLAAFGVISVFSSREGDFEEIEDYRGLAWRHPLQAALLSASMLSLAGIPLTAGFLGKFFVIMAGMESVLWSLLVMLVINSAIGLYYYLRIIVYMYSSTSDVSELKQTGYHTQAFIVLSLLAFLLVFLGIFPNPLLGLLTSVIG